MRAIGGQVDILGPLNDLKEKADVSILGIPSDWLRGNNAGGFYGGSPQPYPGIRLPGLAFARGPRRPT
jgi:hypothetical protein